MLNLNQIHNKQELKYSHTDSRIKVKIVCITGSAFPNSKGGETLTAEQFDTIFEKRWFYYITVAVADLENPSETAKPAPSYHSVEEMVKCTSNSPLDDLSWHGGMSYYSVDEGILTAGCDYCQSSDFETEYDVSDVERSANEVADQFVKFLKRD